MLSATRDAWVSRHPTAAIPCLAVVATVDPRYVVVDGDTGVAGRPDTAVEHLAVGQDAPAHAAGGFFAASYGVIRDDLPSEERDCRHADYVVQWGRGNDCSKKWDASCQVLELQCATQSFGCCT